MCGVEGEQMRGYLSVLEKCNIFNGMEREYIENIIKDKNYKIVTYEKTS